MNKQLIEMEDGLHTGGSKYPLVTAIAILGSYRIISRVTVTNTNFDRGWWVIDPETTLEVDTIKLYGNRTNSTFSPRIVLGDGETRLEACQRTLLQAMQYWVQKETNTPGWLRNQISNKSNTSIRVVSGGLPGLGKRR